MSSSGVEDPSVVVAKDTLPPQPKKGRAKSRDAMSSLEDRLSRAEEHLADFKERLELMEGDDEEGALGMTDLREALFRLQARVESVERRNRESVAEKDAFVDWTKEVLTRHEETMTRYEQTLEQLRREWANRGATTTGVIMRDTPKVEVPRPKSYAGKRDAKEVDNFFWQIEQYFEAVGLTEDISCVKTAILYFTDDAALWWRMRHQELKDGGKELPTWAEFKEAVYAQFYPEEADWEARDKLRTLRHTGTIHEYVREYVSLKLQVRGKPDYDHMYDFIKGLQPWAQQEVRGRRPKTFAEAVSMAESLVEYKKKAEPSKPKKDFKGKGGGAQDKKGYQGQGRDYKSKEYAKDQKEYKPKGCYFCEGPHLWRDCPNKKKALNAIREEECTADEKQIGTLRLLNSLEVKPLPKAPPKEGLMYTEVVVNGKTTQAMLDTGATHNFMAEDEARRLGLSIAKSTSRMKTVNATPKPTSGMAHGVSLVVGTWKGEADFTIVPLDDFRVVLGMEFFKKAKAVPTPHLEQMVILEERNPCMVPAKVRDQHDLKQLSAMQVKKGFKKGADTYLVALREEGSEEGDGNELPKEITSVLEEFDDVMPPELPKKLPPKREIDHQIELVPGVKPPAMAPYRMAPPELEELRRQLKEMLDAGQIQPSKSPYGSPVLFQKKHDGSLRMCVDYRALNKVTVKNRYPIPLIADLFDQLGKARYYTKLDLRSGYYQVRIAAEDVPKTACVTRYGSYEFLVMPFGLTNAPATFCTLMNKVFQPFLDRFVVVYLDDIVIYSDTLEEHVDHLRTVFKVLRENELYVKKEKCSFAKDEVLFLGHKIKGGRLMMDVAKVQAIAAWEAPTKVPDLRSFLGLVNYYRRFIRDYSKKAAPLTDLLKKNKTWEWTDRCQAAFEELKQAVTEEPVLILADPTKPYEIQTDASDFAIGGVLMQDGHPIAYESRKLNDTERRYTVQEKEMTAVVHCLRAWRHYLLGSKFVVKTDNVATSYFQTQKKLTPKQARWQDFLAEFDYTFEYKPGKANVVADALSRKAELCHMTRVEGRVMEKIKEGMTHDPVAKSLLALAKEGKTRRFWEEDGILYTMGRRIYVPKWENLRKDLMKECHDSMWAGHPGQHRTKALLERAYYWPQMGDDVESYVKTCLVCQQDKVENRVPGGLLQPLPIAERPWETVTMDFIVALPKSEGYGSIIVVVDKFSKYATFIAAPADVTAENTAKLLFKHVVKYWGVPRHIISDRDPRFTGKLWTELFGLLGSKLHYSTSFHPQTDGQTERVNSLLEAYLRHFVSAHQRDWAKLLDVAQFSYNLQRSESTNKSPFEVVTEQQPLTPHTLVLGEKYHGSSPMAYSLAKEWHEQADLTRMYLDKAAKKMKKWADKDRRDISFQPGDKVMVKLLPQQHKVFRKVHKGLIRRYEGPYEVVHKVGEVSYKLDLPPKLKIHPVFHVSMLKPYHEDMDDPSRGVSTRAPIAVIDSYDKEVDIILDDRTIRRRGVPPSKEYLVRWKGIPESEATWEPADALWQFAKKIEEYHEGATRTSRE